MRILKKAIIRNFTTSGYKCKQYVYYLEDFTIRVHRLILMPNGKIDYSEFSLRDSTLLCLFDIVKNQPDNTLGKFREQGR